MILRKFGKKYYGGGGGNRTRIQRLRSGESTRLVEFTLVSLLTSSKPTRTYQKLVRLKSRSRPQTVGANQLELSYASFGRFKLTSGETLAWLELTRQQEPILGWRLFFACCFNELTSKPDVHPKINTSPCRSLSPP